MVVTIILYRLKYYCIIGKVEVEVEVEMHLFVAECSPLMEGRFLPGSVVRFGLSISYC